MKGIIGIDLGGTRIKVGLRQSSTDRLSRVEVRPINPELPIEDIFSSVFDAVHSMNGHLSPGSVVGLAIPGDVDLQHGRLNCRRFGLSAFPFSAPFNQQGFRVTAINDAQSSGLGELHFGAGKRYKDFIVLTLGTGIGGAFIVNGKLLKSSSGHTIGIVSHLTIDPHGKPCRCGRRGCWETFCDRQAILSLAQEKGLACPDVDDIAKRAKDGDGVAAEIFCQVGKHLAYGLANLVDIFAPEAVIIAGGISLAGDVLLGPLKKNLLPLVREGRQLGIEASQLGDMGGVFGATIIAEKITLPQPFELKR